ncbi:CSN4 [Scenedesmus sp. PABB004]|nr:CSN4 [Scenedesmus sp. PABB004]
MADVGAQLAAIAAAPDQKQRAESYKQLLLALVAAASEADLNAFTDHMLSDEVPLVISRALLGTLAAEVGKLPAEVHKAVATHALSRIAPRGVSFLEQSTSIREQLAELLQGEEQWAKAAQVLAGIDLDSGVRGVEAGYKLSTHIKIAMLYLEDDDHGAAESYIKKASALIAGSKDPVLELQYKTSYARVMDAKRRFIDAAGRYYELSCITARSVGGLAVGEDDLIGALSNAITCTILAAAGPQRSRLLSQVYKDERSASLPVWPFLEKVYLERILARDEVEAFAATLKPHQMALLPDGSTVLSKAVMQHNLLSASKLYNNISINELGNLLAVAPERAEQMAAEMIGEGRLRGSIDQVDGLIHFEDSLEQLVQWDKQVAGACAKVDAILDALAAARAPPGGAGAEAAVAAG